MAAPSGTIQARQSSSLIVMLMFGLVIALALVVGNFFWLGEKTEDETEYIGLSNDIGVLSQKVAKFSGEAASGNLNAFGELRATRNQIQESLDQLVNGNEEGLPPSPESVQVSLDALGATWMPMRQAADNILGRSEMLVNLAATATGFRSQIPQLQGKIDDVVRTLTEIGAPAQQIYVASRQLVLADRMLRRVGDILQGGEGAVAAADGFERDASLFGRVLSGLLNGSDELGIRAIQNPQALESLGEAFQIFDGIGQNIDEILQASNELFDVRTSADRIFVTSEQLLADAESMVDSYANLSDTRFIPSVAAGLLLGAIAAILVLLLLLFFWREQRSRYMTTAELNQRNQEAILRLLDEMGSLAEGDLTVSATVTEDITGAIADSINFAVEALRSLVTTINETAVQVASAAQETQATAMHLAEASEHQAQQITSASAAVNEIAVSIDEVSKNSSESADVAQRSVAIASKGAEVVRQTIEGMDSIRDQIQETSKRIKRLGESSQEIGDIVELINDIAEQTNILALNAAIQAASAGEAGRGFAVVADEVQRLAERASNATKQIETLVQTIQADTNEAVISMETTTSQVVTGAKLAEDAGEALGEIEKVSHDLADLIQNISEAARQQSAAATNISGTMNVIQEITTQTSTGSSQTADSIGNLANLAAELRKSVADFKLPA